MRVAALREIGGYSEEFWLDLSDVYAFQAMYRKGRYMYIAGDLHVQHSICQLDFDKEMSPERYRNFLAAESAYVDLYSSPLEQVAICFGFLCAPSGNTERYENKTFAKICWEYFCRRLFQTRARRSWAGESNWRSATSLSSKMGGSLDELMTVLESRRHDEGAQDISPVLEFYMIKWCIGPLRASSHRGTPKITALLPSDLSKSG